eukprot:gene6008-4313_t
MKHFFIHREGRLQVENAGGMTAAQPSEVPFDFVGEWQYMDPRSAVDSHGVRGTRKRGDSPETQQEKKIFYAEKYRGASFFTWLNPTNPHRSRLRVERLYWESWHTLCLAFFLTAFGTTLALIGLYFALYTADRGRGWSMMGVSALPILPGYYSLFVIYKVKICAQRNAELNFLLEQETRSVERFTLTLGESNLFKA